MDVQRISIIENNANPVAAHAVAKRFQVEAGTDVSAKVVDYRSAEEHLPSFNPDAVIFDVASLGHIAALDTAMLSRQIKPHQPLFFLPAEADEIAPEARSLSSQWNGLFWLSPEAHKTGTVVPEVLNTCRAFQPGTVLASQPSPQVIHELSPQQHRVMRLVAIGHSNAGIAEECHMTLKAVERTISAASKLLSVTPASPTTNHRVNASNAYLSSISLFDLKQAIIR